MQNQDYTNLNELVSVRAEQLTSLGFDVIGFIGNHTLGFAVTLFILIIAYKWFASLEGKKEEEMEKEIK